MTESTWTVAGPEKLSFDDPVESLSVHVVHGTVNVVGTDDAALASQGGARLEISRIEGPPLIVTRRGSALTIAYDDLPWKSLLKWLDPKGWHRSAVVSLTIPARASVEVVMAGASTVVSGIQGRTEVRGVSGDTTLVGLSGTVHAETVSGSLEAQSVTGALRFSSVSGDLTVVEGAGSSVRADSVSGNMAIDLHSAGEPTDIKLNSVSGEIAIRLPRPADAQVEANTTSGSLSNGFEDLRVSGQWGSKRITGTLGAGTGTLKAMTVSGSIALLRRPATDDEQHGATPAETLSAGAVPTDAPSADAPPADTKEL